MNQYLHDSNSPEFSSGSQNVVPAGKNDAPADDDVPSTGPTATHKRRRRSKRPRPRPAPTEATAPTGETTGRGEPFIGPLPDPDPEPTRRPRRKRPKPRRDPATRPEPPACLAGLLVDHADGESR